MRAGTLSRVTFHLRQLSTIGLEFPNLANSGCLSNMLKQNPGRYNLEIDSVPCSLSHPDLASLQTDI